MKKIITWLYNKYCRPSIDNLYLGGVQRDLSMDLSIHDERNRAEGCISFKESGALEMIINEAVREYVEFLFNKAEKQKIRDLIHNNINVVLGLEQRIIMYANKPPDNIVEDPYNPL